MLLLLAAWALRAAEVAPASAAALATPETLLARAQTLGLARDPYWLSLLHYGWGTFGRRGVIDAPSFYLSPRGQDDPAAEMAATLVGMLAPPPADPEQAVSARFPARCAFLCERLGLERSALPLPTSPELARTLDDYAPRRTTLVFPAGYLASPPSMFGHTLLLVHGRNESPLLSQAINYAAATDGGGLGPFGVLKGLFGFYPGSFSVLPYHRKVQAYTDMDQRDVWEYDLNLTPAESVRLLEHLWELRNATADYWFFDENCSFNLLFLLEAARPGLRLTARGGWWVIPIDTIRWVDAAGLVSAVHFRPSRATAVAYGQAVLGPVARQAEDLARGRLEVTALAGLVAESATRAQVLNLAGEILHALAGRRAIPQADYRQRLHATLTARAALGPQSELPPMPAPTRPDRGHGTGRVSAGAGVEDGHAFIGLGWRPAQHDLLDPPAGFLAGGELRFADVELRSYDDRGLVLHRLSAVRILALNPYEDVFRRLSWTIDIGARTERMGTGDGHLTLQAVAGGGAGASLRLGPAVAYALGLADARGYDQGLGFALGPALQVGVMTGLGRARARIEGTVTRYVLGDVDTRWEAAAVLRVPLSARWAVEGSVQDGEVWERRDRGVALRLLWYY